MVYRFNVNVNITREKFILSSDIRSEGNIAIVKIFDFDFLMVFDSISLPHLKKVF